MKLREKAPDQEDVDAGTQQLRLAADELDEAVQVAPIGAHRMG